MKSFSVSVIMACAGVCLSLLFSTGLLSAQTSSAAESIKQSTLTLQPPKDSITCIITGNVIDRPGSTQAVIIEADRDFRVHDYVVVPVTEGRFTYTLKDTVQRAYEVFFDDELKRGFWRNDRNFFSGNGYVELYYHNDDNVDKDSVLSDISENILAESYSQMEKSQFRAEENRLMALIDSLYENKAVHTREVQAMYDKLDTLPQGRERDSIMVIVTNLNRESRQNASAASKFYSEEYLECEREVKDLYSTIDLKKRKFISDNPSLFGLVSIKKAISSVDDCDWIDLPAYEEVFETLYKDRFKSHPYADEVAGLIEARDVKAGNKYPDFKITREDGTTEQISSLIKGNVAVIDLWASWCAPCRRHSIELIPVYEKYKDKGFKVIAIARERDNCTKMNNAMEKDGYPWESFVDLNDRDNVWRINRAGNSGGKIILVNPDGVIIGTDMPISDIENFLKTTCAE